MDGGITIKMPKAPKPERKQKKGEVLVQEFGKDGTWKQSFWTMPQDLQDSLDEARAEWTRLKEAGTPYWCIHKGREVNHPAAYWKKDGYFRADGLEMQYKHGVMCRECGGYIQEG